MVCDEVRRGAMVLDLVRPDWDGQIDLKKLRTGSTSFCVLGQLYGTYYAGRNELRIHDPVRYGFEAGGPFRSYTQSEKEYDALDRAWAELIRERRGEPGGLRGWLNRLVG